MTTEPVKSADSDNEKAVSKEAKSRAGKLGAEVTNAAHHAVRDERKQKFLEVLAETHNVRAACKAAGISRTTAYTWREQDEQFMLDWENALDDAVEDLLGALHERAKDKSDLAAFFLVKGRRPEYRDSYKVEHSGSVKTGLEAALEGMSLGELQNLLKDAQEALEAVKET